MSNFITKHRRWKMTTAILSLSLLTVMTGAAVILGIWSVLMKSE